MKLRTKFMLSFFCVTLLLLGIGAASKYLNDRVKNQLVTESRLAVHELELTGQTGSELYRSMANIQYFLEERYRRSQNANFEDRGFIFDRTELNIEESLNRADRRIHELQELIRSSRMNNTDMDSTYEASLATLEIFSERVVNYTSLIRQLIQLTNENYTDGKEFFTVTIEPYFRTNLLPLVEQLRSRTKSNLDVKISGLNSRLDSISQWLLYMIIAALVLSLVLAGLLYNSIATPLARLVDATHEIGKGNLDRRIDVQSSDEIGQLGQAFNRMTENLSKVTVSKDYISKSLKEKEILLAEIHHRVKNNLAVISGLLQMQIWESEDDSAREVLVDSQLRVQSIALIHEKLYQSENLSHIQFDNYVGDLLKAIDTTYSDSSRKVSMETEIEPVAMNINQAIPCSLLLNELIVNTFKHAFQGRKEGAIRIRIWKADMKFHVRVSDNGKGLAENFDLDEATSMGMSLINILVKQLNGSLEAYNDKGAVFQIHFPAEEVV